ncbi:MAG: TRAP transporter substrate-binding protein [Thermodesulfobacteriota bacterium]|nr:TRAP transporter substrate-binding protein [Thermodesulfobacteriota bacterium]
MGLVFLLTLLFISPSNSLAAEKPIVLKFAHQLPETQPVAKQARFFEKLVQEKSKGRVTIEIYPAAQLFTARDLFPAVKRGAVEMAAVVIGPMQGAIPLMEIFDIPFVFTEFEQVKKGWYGYLGEVLKKELEKQGVYWLAPGYYGFAQASNNKREIRSPDDFKGLKIRTVGPLTAEIVTLMGGGVVVMGGDEAYLAMAKGVVDGSITGNVTMATRKYYEIQKYVTILNLGYIGIPMLINLEVWNSLPKEIQKLIQECATESGEFVLKETIEEEKKSVEILKEKGMIVYTPTKAEMEKFKKTAATIKDKWLKRHGEVAAKLIKFVEEIK